jgi:hypothetical protein
MDRATLRNNNDRCRTDARLTALPGDVVERQQVMNACTRARPMSIKCGIVGLPNVGNHAFNA